MDKLSTNMNNNQNNHVNGRYKAEQRRMKIASLLAQSMNEVEIARELGVGQATVSRDIKVLKELSQQFVFDLAKSDLAYYYKQCIDGIEEVRRKAWDMFKAKKKNNDSGSDGGDYDELIPRDKLLALKVIRECNEAKYSLFQQGPSIMNVKSLEERLIKIEEGNSNRQNFE
jgi:Trp repressor protein